MKDKKEKWWKRLLQGFDPLPGYWLFLAIFACIGFVVTGIEKNWVFDFSYFPLVFLGVEGFTLAIYFKLKYRRKKDADKEDR